MRDSMGSMTDLFVLIIVAVLFPVFVAGSYIQGASDSEAARLGSQFLSKASSFGGFSENDLEKFRESLAVTGGGYELSLEHRTQLYVPKPLGELPVTGRLQNGEVECFISARNTSEICRCLAETGEYSLDYGDVLELAIRSRADGQTVFRDYAASLSAASYEGGIG